MNRNKVKEFYEKNKREIRDVVFCCVGCTIGWIVGQAVLTHHHNVGLNACFLVKPELKPMMLEALNEVEKKI